MIKKFLRDETVWSFPNTPWRAVVALAVITAFGTLGTNISGKIGNLATKIGTP